MATDAITRAAGYLVYMNITKTSAGLPRTQTGIFYAPSLSTSTVNLCLVMANVDGRIYMDKEPVSGVIPSQASKEIALILRETGGFFLQKIGSTWVLMWVGNSGSTSTLYVGNNQYDTDQQSWDTWRHAQLAAPWDTDNGIATDTELGSVGAGTTFVHEADCIIEFTVDTVASSGEIVVFFRVQDSSNYWACWITDSGTLYLRECVAGSLTNRGNTSGGFVANGERVVIICDDETVTIYGNNTQAFSYSSAANFKTETAGELDSLGTGGVVSDIITWPRIISSTALEELTKYTDA